MKKLIPFVLAAIMLTGGTAAQAQTEQDRRFVEQAAVDIGAIIRAAELALIRASDDRVRTLAQRMVEDHTPMGQELIVLAQDAGIPPSATDVTGENPDRPESLADQSGVEFDQAYLSDTVRMHERLTAAFEREVADGADAPPKIFAANHLPALREHLDILRALKAEMPASMQQ